jgi:hypothetical protein
MVLSATIADRRVNSKSMTSPFKAACPRFQTRSWFVVRQAALWLESFGLRLRHLHGLWPLTHAPLLPQAATLLSRT